MKIVLQRVKRARVTVGDRVAGEIGGGLLLLIGVRSGDTPEEAAFLAGKCSELRVFPDSDGKMNKSLLDVDGEALVVSQFTLYGDCRKGRRPSYTEAAPPETGNRLYEYFVSKLRESVRRVETGEFGAMMDVELVNDGPVTLVVERDRAETTS